MIRAALFLLILAWPALAKEGALVAAGDALARAEAALAAAEDAEDRRAAISEAVRAYEEGRLALRDAMVATAAEQRRKARLLREGNKDLGSVLAALQQISKRSEPLFILGTAAPEDVVLAGILLDHVSDRAAAEMRALREELAELAALKAQAREIDGQVKASSKALETAIGALSEESIPADLTADIGQDAANLSALAIALDGVPAPLAGGGAPDTKLPVPVLGRITRSFNEPNTAGARRPGTFIAASPAYLVNTPLSATVRFAGVLDSYGRVVIVEPDPGVLFVFAGLGDVLVQAGTEVIAGTGLGFLPGVHEEFLIGDAQRDSDLRQQSLYIEVRVNGTPVDPALWFAYENEE